jgi:endonuclease
MSSPPCDITVTCPACKKDFVTWHRPSMNLLLDDFDEAYLREATVKVCPHCRHEMHLDSLVVGQDGVWRIGDAGNYGAIARRNQRFAKGSCHGMKEGRHPYVWQMIREAIQALGSPTTNRAVRDWILRKYPETNTNTLQCQIIICTVNHPSRVHYPENKKPRLADSQYDFLFRPERGKLELYDAERHGQWCIMESDDGVLTVTNRVLGGATEGRDTDDRGFAAEAHLRDYLALHLTEVEPGLELYTEEDGTDGIEYQTDVGRIDILAIDKSGRFVVIELKVDDAPDKVCGQLLRYMGWVKRHLADGQPVRGIIIGQFLSDKVRYAMADVPLVDLHEYELSLRLRTVPRLENPVVHG